MASQPAVSTGHPAAGMPGCPVDIRPVDILAQRQDFWIARPTLKAIDQEQSLATVHHAQKHQCKGRSGLSGSLTPWSHLPYFSNHSSLLNTGGSSAT